MEFYSAMKKNEILSFVSKWIEPEYIILSKVSQVPKANNRMFSCMDYASKTNAVMLLDVGHTLRGECTQGRNRESKGNLKLECG
jgi:hypothetical protein